MKRIFFATAIFFSAEFITFTAFAEDASLSHPTVRESFKSKGLWPGPEREAPLLKREKDTEGEKKLILGKGKAKLFISSKAFPLKIIIPGDNPLLNIVGNDLQKYIKEITGISPDLETTGKFKEGNYIILKLLSEKKDSENEGFIIESEFNKKNNILWIKASNDIGLQYGAYHFLELLGVRFFNPRQDFIPNAKEIFLGQIYLKENPAFEVRGMHAHNGMSYVAALEVYPLNSIFKKWVKEKDIVKAKELIDWLAKNKQNFVYNFLHAFPEIQTYAKQRGVLGNGMLNLYPKVTQGPFKADNLKLLANYEKQLKKLEKHKYIFLANPEYERSISNDVIEDMLKNRIPLFMKAFQKNPKSKAILNIHGSYEQTPKLKIIEKMPPEIVGDIHTLLDRNLFESCWDAYGLNDYKAFLDSYKEELQKGREMWYFPEVTWGCNYDIDVPIFRPYYLYSRWLDSVYLKKMGVKGHFTYSQGFDWQYWLLLWGTFKLQWSPLKNHWLNIVDDYASIYSEPLKSKVKTSFEKNMQAWELIDRSGLSMSIGLRTELYRNLFILKLGGAMSEMEWKSKLNAFSRASQMAGDAYHSLLETEKPLGSAQPFYQEMIDSLAVGYYHLRHHYLAYKIIDHISNLKKEGNVDDEIKHTYMNMLECTKKVQDVIKRRKNAYIYPNDFQIALEEDDKQKLRKIFSEDILNFYDDGYLIKLADQAMAPFLEHYLKSNRMTTISLDSFENEKPGNNWSIDGGSLEIVEDSKEKGNHVLKAAINFKKPLQPESVFINCELPETLDLTHGCMVTFKYKFSNNKISSKRCKGRTIGMVFRMRSNRKGAWYNDIPMIKGNEIEPNRWYKGIIPVNIGTSTRLFDYKLKTLSFRIQDIPESQGKLDFYLDDLKIIKSCKP